MASEYSLKGFPYRMLRDKDTQARAAFPIIEADESVLYYAPAHARALLASQVPSYLIGLAIIAGGVYLFLTSKQLDDAGLSAAAIFGVVTFIAFVVNVKVAYTSRFALTPTRALIHYRTPITEHTDIIELGEVKDCKVDVNIIGKRFGAGSIRFFTGREGPNSSAPAAFKYITDYDNVYKMINQARKALAGDQKR